MKTLKQFINEVSLTKLVRYRQAATKNRDFQAITDNEDKYWRRMRGLELSNKKINKKMRVGRLINGGNLSETKGMVNKDRSAYVKSPALAGGLGALIAGRKGAAIGAGFGLASAAYRNSKKGRRNAYINQKSIEAMEKENRRLKHSLK